MLTKLKHLLNNSASIKAEVGVLKSQVSVDLVSLLTLSKTVLFSGRTKKNPLFTWRTGG